MKINPSVKVSIAALAIFGLGYAAYWGFGEAQLSGFEPEPIKPGQVNLVAFKTDTNLRIRVANRMAQLVELNNSSGDLAAGDMNDADISDAKRIPIREFLEVLQGDEEALGEFITTLNGLRGDEPLPADAVVWSADDLQKALDGDPDLVAKLEQDIHMKLDGMPLGSVQMSAILNGIIVELPVPVQVPIEGKMQTLVGVVQEPYRPRFSIALENSLQEDFEPSQSKIVGNYQELAKPILSGENSPENVRRELERLVGPERKKSLAEKPERLLQGAQVLVADSLFEGASYETYEDDRGEKTYNLKIKVNEEARKRLWKYSRDTKGFELLVVVDGIAVAAPRIITELSGREVTVSKLKDKALAERTVEAINNASKGSDQS